MFIGVALVLQKPAFWILVVFLVILQAIRARKEARVLEDTFGEEYREYRRKTWF
jgi:protein-S-isoprenylcysteine O-methyltransferase Ste14